MKTAVRKTTKYILAALLAALLILITTSAASSAAGSAQDRLEDTPTETPVPTETATATPTATATTPPTEPGSSGRPIVVFDGYGVSGGVRPGQEFTLTFRLANPGGSKARNVMVIFSAGDFVPRSNGGVLAAGTLAAGAATGYSQPMTASGALAADSIGTTGVTVNYTDESGNPYSESFTLGLYVGSGKPVPSGPRAPTPTPAPRPQLLITSYDQDVDLLKPGTRFELAFHVLNVGGKPAQRVFMVLGGGGQSSQPPGDDKGDNADGPGGLTGSGGDFSNFAPVGASNVQFLGNLENDQTLVVRQQMIVNSTTKPGAYTIRISFTYQDDKGATLTDDQIVTLLVSQPPVLEVSFYRPLDPFFAGQPGMLPVQVVNLDRNTTILGRMTVTSELGFVENGSILVGYLDPGGYFPHDVVITPNQTGPVSVLVSVDYLDDFNVQRSFTQEFSLEVSEMAIIDPGLGYPPGEDPGQMPTGEEMTWQIVLRFLRGMVGLDSAPVAGPSPVIDQGPMEGPSPGDGPSSGPGPKG